MRRALFLILIGICGTTSLPAQSILGSMTGTVKDPSGQVIVGVQITVANVQTGAERIATTNDQGDFTITNLEPATYRLSARMNGFKTLTKDNVVLPASERLPLGDLSMQLGAVAESVTVTSEGATVQIASSERSGVITATQVDSLLIKNRSIYSMLAILPGIQDEREEEQPTFVWGILALGGRQTTTDISLDGISTVNRTENRSSTVDVAMNSVAEVKVLTGVFQAEYGRMAGASVQLVTKSGTKDFHGGASYYKRHEQFNANSFFNNRNSRPKPRYRFNSWSYNLGGPVYIPNTFNKNRSKLFFFWTQEFWPTTQSSLGTLTVPTALERQGDFSQSVDVNGRPVTVLDPLTQQALPGSKVPAARLNQSGLALMKMFPEPNFLDVATSKRQYNYVLEKPADRNYRSQSLKLNYNLSAKHIFSVNWSARTDPRSGYFGQQHFTSNTWQQLAADETNKGVGLITRYNAILSPSLVNEVSFGLTRQTMLTRSTEQALRTNRRDVVGFTAGQINPASNPLNLIPDATFGGITGAASLAMDYRFPEILIQPQWQLTDTLTKTYRTHTFKAGISAEHFFGDETGYDYYRGRIAFGTSTTNPIDSKYAYANAAFGVYDSYTEESVMPHYYPRISRFEWFTQDTWKAVRRLTLDYGMRFSWIPFPTEESAFVSGCVPGRWKASAAPVLLRPAMVGGKKVAVNPITGEALTSTLVGALAPGVGDPYNGIVVPQNDKNYPKGLVRNRGILLGPRAGFAWDVFGKGKTAIRGGAGILYSQPWGYDVVRTFTNQAPAVFTQTLYYQTLDTLQSARGYLFPIAILGMDPNGKMPTTYNTSLALQQSIGFGTVVEAAYVGSYSRHLEYTIQQNEVPLGANFKPANADPSNPSVALPANFLRPMAGYTNVGLYQWNGSSYYHSLQVQANRRFAKWLQFGANWTWAKNMGLGSGTADRETISLLVPLSWYRGVTGLDRTHMLKLNWVFDLPKASGVLGAKPFTSRVLDGWRVSGIARFISGAPAAVSWSATPTVDISGTASLTARVDYIGNPVLPKDERTFDRNFRTEVFRQPAVGTLGNSAKYYLRGPGINNWDIACFKEFLIKEPNVRFQLRWETYNTFNHTQFSSMDAAARFDSKGTQISTSFGSFTAARNPRYMQMSLNLNF